MPSSWGLRFAAAISVLMRAGRDRLDVNQQLWLMRCCDERPLERSAREERTGHRELLQRASLADDPPREVGQCFGRVSRDDGLHARSWLLGMGTDHESAVLVYPNR
jgi:hypothetical protein